MTDDTRFDDMIARSARELDPPADPPRDAMWAAIQEARAAAPAPARTAPWLHYGAALAAMLVIGIGIGRITTGIRTVSTAPQATADARAADSAGRTAQSEGATATSPDARRADGAGTLLPGAGPADAIRQSASPDPRLAAIDRPPVGRVTPIDGGPALARSTRSASSVTVEREGAGRRTYDTMLPYRIVARRHLERVHTLLVSLPADVRDGRINDVAARAADLLVSTRLLLDTPAAEDAQVHRLLDDVELILAQAATISPIHSADDVEIIQNAINKRDVLLRLHAATAGSRLTGT